MWDYVKATAAASSRPYLLLALVAAALPVGIVLLRAMSPPGGNEPGEVADTHDSFGTLLCFLFPAIAVFILLPLAVILQVWLRWHAAPLLREAVTVELGEDGIVTTAATASGKTAWANVRKVKRRWGLVIVTQTSRISYLIPLRAFPDPASYEAFKTLVKQKVPDSRHL
jgi:hypothetical protein